MSAAGHWHAADIQAAMGGDSLAFERLITASMRMVTAIAFTIVRDIDASEDVAQQVYISLWKRLHSLKTPASFLPWLREMTRNTALNYIRDNKLTRRASEEEAEACFARLLDENAPLEVQIDREQQSMLLRRLIDALPADSRDVVVLYYREERSTSHVAMLLGLQEDTVRQRLSRARALLKESVLNHCGRALVLTAPGIGFATFTGSLMTASSQAVAASAAAVAAKHSAGLGKLLALLSGFGVGAMAGVVGVMLGAAPAIKRAPTPYHRQTLLRIRNRTILWVMFSVLLLFAAYECTQGWWAPLASYTVFYAGMVWSTLHVNKVIYSAGFLQGVGGNMQSRGARWGRFACFGGLLLGGVGGFAGLVVGMINSGRW